jgi:two-component system heavy metal sensor histidine kinase CusS
VIVAVDGEKVPIFAWPDAGTARALAEAAAAVGETPLRLELAGREYRAVAGALATGWGEAARVVVARDIRHHTDFLDQLRRDLWLAVLAAALLTAIVGLLVARRGLLPVRAIARTAGRISAGRLGERIPDRAVPVELAELVNAFNAMLGRLEEAFRRLSDFSADLAHELRTPIHTLRTQTEVALGKARGVDEYRDLLASSLEEYERLSRIINDMLFLAKAEHGLVAPGREAIGLRELCRRLVEYYGILAEDIGLELRGDDFSIDGDRLMLERAIGNLLVNAIHHTPSGGRIVLAIAREPEEAVIAVSNTGPPIPPDALCTIFDRFVRLNRDHEGSGLGLAITRSIVHAHHGTMAVRSGEQTTEFVIRIPLRVAP